MDHDAAAPDWVMSIHVTSPRKLSTSPTEPSPERHRVLHGADDPDARHRVDLAVGPLHQAGEGPGVVECGLARHPPGRDLGHDEVVEGLVEAVAGPGGPVAAAALVPLEHHPPALSSVADVECGRLGVLAGEEVVAAFVHDGTRPDLQAPGPDLGGRITLAPGEHELVRACVRVRLVLDRGRRTRDLARVRRDRRVHAARRPSRSEAPGDPGDDGGGTQPRDDRDGPATAYGAVPGSHVVGHRQVVAVGDRGVELALPVDVGAHALVLPPGVSLAPVDTVPVPDRLSRSETAAGTKNATHE